MTRGGRTASPASFFCLACLALAGAVVDAGCAFNVRVAVGPTVDTFGRPGVECRVTAGAQAIVPARAHAVLVGVEAGGGGGLLGHERVGVGLLRAGVAVTTRFAAVDLAGSVYYSARSFTAPMSVGHLDGVGAGLLVLREVKTIGDSGWLRLGGALDGEYATDGNSGRGIFGFAFALELSKLIFIGR